MRKGSADLGGQTRRLTDIAQEDWQEDETVRGAEQDDAQVHPEIENLEDLRFRETQHDDPAKLGQCDAREHLNIKRNWLLTRGQTLRVGFALL